MSRSNFYSNSPAATTPHLQQQRTERVSRRVTPKAPFPSSSPSSPATNLFSRQHVAYYSPQTAPCSRYQKTISSSFESASRRLKMAASSATTTPTSATYPYPYLVVPNLHVPDPAGPEFDLATQPAWVMATVIEDDDLTFGGKPLSAWYEEERAGCCASTASASSSSASSMRSGSSEGEITDEDEEELRGRQRVRSHHHRSKKDKKSSRKQ